MPGRPLWFCYKFVKAIMSFPIHFIVSPQTNCLHGLGQAADLCASYQGLKHSVDPREEFTPHVSSEAFRALSNSKPTPSAPLCPNIRNLGWADPLLDDTDDNDIFPYIRLFLGPSTKYLSFTLNGADFSRISIILFLPRDYPGLTHIDIYSVEDSDFWCDGISDTVCQWNSLESISWSGDMSCRALIHLAGLSTLRRIDIRIPDLVAPDWQRYHSALQAVGFQALTQADIFCKDIMSCTSLINRTSLRQLVSITIGFYDGHNKAADVGHFFRTLSTRCSHTTLTKFVVSPYFNHYPQPFGTIDEDLIRPLLEFHNMTDFHIEFPLAFRLGDRILSDIAASWKHLRSLCIGMNGGWAGQSQISLGGLIPLLSLPKLEEFNIVINASVVEHMLDLLPAGVRNTKISSLSLADSVIQDEHSVAAFLSDVLPNVKKIDSWHGAAAHNASVSRAEAKEYRDRWNMVAALIGTFSKVREQERRGMGKSAEGGGQYEHQQSSHKERGVFEGGRV
jgi:hypothetical protein